MIETGNVKVAIRPKPMSDNENDSCKSILHLFSDKPQMIAALDKPFTFDYVFGVSAIQAEIYDEFVKPLLKKLLQGYNCLVMAYGSTGTGKTYTMGTADKTSNQSDAGIIPRVLDYLFSEDVQGEGASCELAVSFLQIYRGEIYNLLKHVKKEVSLIDARQDTGLLVRSTAEALTLLASGALSRNVRSTNLNAVSSRSHAVFTIHYKRTDSTGAVVCSSLRLVDLAGSEGVGRSGVNGVAFNEAVDINRGLLALGKVMRALSAGERPNYREHVLCTFLQDSLTVKSYVSLMACISQLPADRSATIETLRFATNVRNTKLMPEQMKAFMEYKLANSAVFEQMQHLNTAVPPTPTASKTLLPRYKSPSLSNIRSAMDMPISRPSFIAAAEPKSDSCSPIVRKCFEKLESHLDVKLGNIVKNVFEKRKSMLLHENMDETIPSTPAATVDSEQWKLMCSDIRTVVRDEIKSVFEKQMMSNKKNICNSSATRNSVKCKLDFHNDEVFKLPKIPITKVQKGYKARRQSNKFKPQENINDSKETLYNDQENNNVSSSRKTTKLRSDFDSIINSEAPQFLNDEISPLKINPLRRSMRISNMISQEQCTRSTPRNRGRQPTRQSKAKMSSTINFDAPSFTELDDSPIERDFSRNTRVSDTMHQGKYNNKENTSQSIKSQARRQSKIGMSATIISEASSFIDFEDSPVRKGPPRRSMRLSILKDVTYNPKTKANVASQSIAKALESRRKMEPDLEEMTPKTKRIRKEKMEISIQEVHQAAVVQVLQNGSEKELMKLATIGPKTATQIFTYRMLYGKFENIDDLKTAPFWRGNGYERFLIGNNLPLNELVL